MSSASHATDTAHSYRCARCGIESVERTCFALPERPSKSALETNCLMCAQAGGTSTQRGLWQFSSNALSLLIILFLLKRGDLHITAPLLLGALLAHPVAIVAHELGHVLVAKLMGLEMGAITIGFGPRIARFALGGIPVHLHAWPLSGFVHLGAANKTLLRTRAWLTTAAGPLTNVGLVVVTTVCASALESVVDADLLTLWLLANLTLLLAAILPSRGYLAGQSYRSDGQQLLDLPRAPAEHLDLYLSSALTIRSLSLFEAGDHAGAKAMARQLLERVPDSHTARIMISANNSHLGEHAQTLELLAPLLEAIDTLDAPARAAVRNNMAYALIMSSATASAREEGSLQQAAKLSAEAFAAYPCSLAYRSTRALVLTALGQPSEALTLLQYVHYESASATERSHREAARAFAWHRLNRTDTAMHAAGTAVALNPAMSDVLNTLLSACLADTSELTSRAASYKCEPHRRFFGPGPA